MLTQKTCIKPVKNRKTDSWEKIIEYFLTQFFDRVRIVISDRETALISTHFRKKMKTRLGIDWHFMRGKHKAFLAERMIRHFKTKFSQALMANSTSRNWIQYIEPLMKHFNSQKRTGTTFVRSKIDENNFLQVLDQLHGTKDSSLLFNLIDIEHFPKRSLADKIFKFKLGDFVLIRRGKEKNAFSKPSMIGGFSETPFRVKRRLLKDSANLFLTPVYELEKKKGYFYQNDLVSYHGSVSDTQND